MYTPFGSGGHARYTEELLTALSTVDRDSGVRVSLVTTQDLAATHRTCGYPIYDILPPLLPRTSFRSALHWASSRFVYYFQRERAFVHWVERSNACDGIHFQDYTPWLAPRHFRRLKARGKLLFYTVHNIYPHDYLGGAMPAIFQAKHHAWERAAWRSCDALFVHTDDLRNQLSGFLGPGHPPIFVTPHGVWTSANNAPPTGVEERIKRRRLLFFGIIRQNKGLHVLLQAMHQLLDCTLTIAGAPEQLRYHKLIRSLAKQLPSGQVELVDRFIEDTEIARLFSESSLVILPYTNFAAQSGVLHDALAYGIPVVATDVGGMGESVQRWGIGQVVPPNDAVALANGIRDMLTPRCYVAASEAVRRIRNDLSWVRAAEITIEAYRTVGQGIGASAL